MEASEQGSIDSTQYSRTDRTRVVDWSERDEINEMKDRHDECPRPCYPSGQKDGVKSARHGRESTGKRMSQHGWMDMGTYLVHDSFCRPGVCEPLMWYSR